MVPVTGMNSVAVRPALWHDEPMNITTMLAELKAERDGIEQAIFVLEGIASGRGKRRGRPPKWMTEQKKRGRPPGSKNQPKANSGGSGS